MSIVFDEIVGTVTNGNSPEQQTEQAEKKEQRPPEQVAFRHIRARLERRQRLQARLYAD